MPSGVFPEPKLRRTPSTRVRTRRDLAVRVRPSSAPASPSERPAMPPTAAWPGDIRPSRSIAEQLERQSFLPIESTIPTDMTAEQWRRQRSAPSSPAGTLSHHLPVRHRRPLLDGHRPSNAQSR
jgi:hypothetical protein